MKTNTFKTNINCASCVAKVTNTLDQLVGKDHWKVDTTNPQKILTIEESDKTSDEIITAIQGIGYKIELA